MSEQATPPQDSFIEVRDLVKVYQTPAGGYTALKSLNVQVNRGEFVAVIGKSGSGKSTFINMITGIDRPTSGEVWVGGTAIHKLNETGMAKWRGQNLGIVFQFFQLLPTLTLIQNVMLAMELNNTYRGKERHDRAMHLLEMVEMAAQANKLPSAVSGGQQQRVAIARALANDPPLIVADEPTGSLDSKTADKIFGLFEKLVDSGKTILVVTHDDDQVKRATRSIVISDGEVVNEYLVQALRVLTQDQLVEVTRKVEPRVYPANADIIRQGEMGDHLYIITSGKVDVFVEPPGGVETHVNQLRAGQYFGEMALMGDGLRTATVKAASDNEVSVVALDALTFNEVVEESSSLRSELSDLVEKRQIGNQLQAISLLDKDRLAELTKGVAVRSFPAGTPIIRQGAVGETFYILLDGAVDVVLELPDGQERLINHLKSGQAFGELALIGNKRRTASVRVSKDGPAKVVELTAAAFEKLAGESEQFRQVVAQLRDERQAGLSAKYRLPGRPS